MRSGRYLLWGFVFEVWSLEQILSGTTTVSARKGDSGYHVLCGASARVMEVTPSLAWHRVGWEPVDVGAFPPLLWHGAHISGPSY